MMQYSFTIPRLKLDLIRIGRSIIPLPAGLMESNWELHNKDVPVMFRVS
jgi:hypothetical protein